jgi:hypothetical protein
MSTLFVNNLNTASGTTITIPTGKSLVVTDTGGLKVPGQPVQIVTNTATSTVNATSTSDVDLITVSITPKYSNSVIHIEGYVGHVNTTVGTSNAYSTVRIKDPSGNTLCRAVTGQAGAESASIAALGIHSPSSTSSQTYKLTIANASGGTGTSSTDGQYYTIKCIEIAQ